MTDALVAEVEAWVDANWDDTITVREWWRRLSEAGYAYPTWPEGVGGFGAKASDARAIAAVLAGHHVVGPPLGHLAATLAAPTILAHGTRAQISTLVGDIARGEAAWCQLFSEPGSGSDLASVGTRAVRNGDEWVVTGQKVWNSAADSADMGMLLARTDLDVPKHRGMTYFALDMHQSGVEARPLRTMSGSSQFCEVFLTEARVSADLQIGPLGDGWRVAQTTLAAERASLAGGALAGLVPARSGRHGDLDRTVDEIIERAQASLNARRSTIRTGAVPAEAMIDLARERDVHTDPLIRQDLARYHSQVRINGWTMRRMAAAGGGLTGADGSIAKLTTSRICQDSRELSLRIAGATATLSGPDSPMGGDLVTVGLASPGNRLGGGSDEIQLNILGEKGCGLPREPGDDKDTPYRDLAVGTQRG